MEDLETIEEKFNGNVELIDKEFLVAIKNPDKKTVFELEQEYRNKLHKEVLRYEEEFNRFLKIHKKLPKDFEDVNRLLDHEEKEIEEGALNMDGVYVAKGLDMGLSPSERRRISGEINSFRNRVRYRNLYHKYFPSFLVIFYFKFRIFCKRFKLGFSDLIFRIESGTRQDFASLIEITSGGTGKILLAINSFYGKVKGFAKSRIFKEKVSIEEKSEDAKIAEKLLKGSN